MHVFARVYNFVFFFQKRSGSYKHHFSWSFLHRLFFCFFLILFPLHNYYCNAICCNRRLFDLKFWSKLYLNSNQNEAQLIYILDSNFPNCSCYAVWTGSGNWCDVWEIYNTRNFWNREENKVSLIWYVIHRFVITKINFTILCYLAVGCCFIFIFWRALWSTFHIFNLHIISHYN